MTDLPGFQTSRDDSDTTSFLGIGNEGGALRIEKAARFALLAAAVANRTIVVTGGGGDRVWTDGERIFVSDSEDEDVVRDGVIVQAALLAGGSLNLPTIARLMGRRRLRLRYLTLEAQRTAIQLDFVVPRRILERVAAVYNGPVSRSREESLDRALGKDEIPEAPVWLGTIKAGKLIMASPSIGGSHPVMEDLSRNAGVRELDDEEDSEEMSRFIKLLSGPISSPWGDFLLNLLGMGRSPQAGAGASGYLPVGSRRAGKVGVNAKRVADGMFKHVPIEAPPAGRLYPEWDCHQGVYRRDWCAVAEYNPRPSEKHYVQRETGIRLRRELARLGLAYRLHRRQPEGDSLDLTSLIDLMIDRSMGMSGDDRIYEMRLRTAHDLGVLILLDATGSTGESTEGRRVFDEQRELAALLTSVLGEFGNRVATYGFQSWGRQSVNFLRVKGFDDQYNYAAKRRIAALEPQGFTRLGAAIRHGVYRLSTEAGTSNMLLVVIGDGLPYDDGYEGRYAQEDSRRALQEAVTKGVGCACISVRSSTKPDVIERVWGHMSHRLLEDPSELAAHVRLLFRDAMCDAAARRRPIERYSHGKRPKTKRRQSMEGVN
jgi:hypothetical protein